MRTNEFFASQMKEGLQLEWKSTSMPLALSRRKDLIISINFKIVGYRHSFQQLVVSKLLKKRPLRAKDILRKKGFEKGYKHKKEGFVKREKTLKIKNGRR